MPNGSEPKTAAEWTSVCRRFVDDGDHVLAIGKRIMAYDNYDYAVEAASKALIVRRVLPQWPQPGEPHAGEVYSHSVLRLIKYAGVFQRFCDDRSADRLLRENWLIAKEWVPNRYSTKPPEQKVVVRFGRAAKGIITWLDNQ